MKTYNKAYDVKWLNECVVDIGNTFIGQIGNTSRFKFDQNEIHLLVSDNLWYRVGYRDLVNNSMKCTGWYTSEEWDILITVYDQWINRTMERAFDI